MQLARQPLFQNLFGDFVYLLPRDVSKPQNRLFQKKFKQGGLKIYFCENSRGIAHFFTLTVEFLDKTKFTLEIPDKAKFNPWIFHKTVLASWIPWKFQGQKQRPMEIPHYFFLVTLGNSTSFLINPQKFHVVFLCYPWKFHILSPPVWILSGIAQLILILHLALFCYLSIIIADQTCYSIDRQGELLFKLIFSDLTSSQQSVYRLWRAKALFNTNFKYNTKLKKNNIKLRDNTKLKRSNTKLEKNNTKLRK